MLLDLYFHHSAKVDPVYYGGGKQHEAERTRLFREHWDYLDGLREIQVQVADDIRGARTVSIPLDMPIPADLAGRAMRGNVRAEVPPTVADIMDDPLMLATLALMIDEADD